MANPEHLQILEQGVEAWNQWRNKNRDIAPDLSKADLHEAILTRTGLVETNLGGGLLTWKNNIGANLSRAGLTGANLAGANLTAANLHEAILTNAGLTEASLREANLRRANLTGADLTGADLTEAILFRAILVEADLREADLSRAALSETVFSTTNLTTVRGLESCEHFAPSMLDHRTIVPSRSPGRFP